ncbi:sugar ABC transporter substrate-binding protein [Streptomyces sp. N2-109]|uniref:Sugar ABC transporter substrate-binding protein n=1 Tax=Streptomyces gossypii TaxID=2883101 RepID=A0ABT2K1N9_9ACTN|nr:sugar ABC transporter substrate-binding protein [Streptomyces gossypii]MCT2594087.1 sugar ABC transporter substrate-binding protein [Streptomyces gossypii]
MRTRPHSPAAPRRRRTAALAATAAFALLATACGGGSTGGDKGSNDSPDSLTYWASNQGSSIEHDKEVLEPELEKFEKETGIEVKLEVVPWDSLLDRILAATSSGQGPDVLNIGNTWSASLQATGALLPWDAKNLEKIGGRDRFSSSALAAAGAEGKDPAAVPLYSLAYGLYYNKKMFADAGIEKPPATWEEFQETGEKLTKDGKYGLAVEGGNPVENAHHAFVFGKQHGADFFDIAGEPTFDGPENVAAVKQYIDFLGKDGIAAEGNAEYTKNESVRDFATGKAGMLMWQAAASSLASHGMKPDEYGVVPIPLPGAEAGTDAQINSMVAGINMSVFKNTDNIDGALKFVEFMTSTEEQTILNSAYGSIPPVEEAAKDKAFSTPDLKVLRKVLAESSAPLPQVPDESKFETLVGTAMKELFAQAAAGKEVTTGDIKERLTEAQQQMQK